MKRLTMTGWIALAAFNCLVLVPWLGSRWQQPHDFGVFYAASQMYLHEAPEKLYDLNLQAATEKRLFRIPDDQVAKRVLPYNHLPYEIVLWLPLTRLSAERAAWVWRLASLGLLFFAVWLFGRTFPMQRDTKQLFFIALAFFPVPFCLMTGQDTLVTLAILAVSLWLLQDGRNALAGFVLGLGLFKLQLILPIIGIFFLLRCWRLIAGFAVSAAAVLGASTLMVGVRGMNSLLHLWLQGETGGVACINPVTMPNIRGLLSCLPGLSSHAVSVATLLISIVLLLVAVRQARGAPSTTHLFAMALCFVVLVSFHTNLYDLALLIFPALLLLDGCGDTKPLSWTTRLPLELVLCPVTYLVVLALYKVALFALVVGWLWYALAVAAKEQKADLVTVCSVPDITATPTFAGASRS